jgi:hypothetical protein
MEHTAQNTLHTECCVLHTAPCTLHSSHCTLHTTNTMHAVCHTLRAAQCTLHAVSEGGYGLLSLRQINTCRKVPLLINLLDDDILHCLLWVRSFYGWTVRAGISYNNCSEDTISYGKPRPATINICKHCSFKARFWRWSYTFKPDIFRMCCVWQNC